MDNGEVNLFSAHRVQHNNSRGPFKGGFKYHPEADLADVERWGRHVQLTALSKECN